MSNEIDRLLEIADENGDGELECATAPPYNDCEFYVNSHLCAGEYAPWC